MRTIIRLLLIVMIILLFIGQASASVVFTDNFTGTYYETYLSSNLTRITTGGETWASVVYTGTEYRMYYSISGTLNYIGWKNSSDGRNWVDQGIAMSNGTPAEWDDTLWVPAVAYDPDDSLWHMIYTGSSPRGIGHATSTDGIIWTKDPNNPVYTGTGTWLNDYIESWGWRKENGTYYIQLNTIGTTKRNATIATTNNLSATSNWSLVQTNPIWFDSFCAYLFKYGGFYYAAIPHYTVLPTSYPVIELWRDTTPFMNTSVKIKDIILEEQSENNLDTLWLVSNISTDINSSDVLLYYSDVISTWGTQQGNISNFTAFVEPSPLNTSKWTHDAYGLTAFNLSNGFNFKYGMPHSGGTTEWLVDGTDKGFQTHANLTLTNSSSISVVFNISIKDTIALGYMQGGAGLLADDGTIIVWAGEYDDTTSIRIRRGIVVENNSGSALGGYTKSTNLYYLTKSSGDNTTFNITHNGGTGLITVYDNNIEIVNFTRNSTLSKVALVGSVYQAQPPIEDITIHNITIYDNNITQQCDGTITGTLPNQTGITSIENDTTWDTLTNCSLGGNITIGNGTSRINFSLLNSPNITIPGSSKILIGNSSQYGINFTMYNSTVFWDTNLTHNESELILESVSNTMGTYGSVLNITYSKFTTSTVNYSENDATTRALGLYLKSNGRQHETGYYNWNKFNNTVVISDTILENMGRQVYRHTGISSKWKNGQYGAISVTNLVSGTDVGFNYTDNSYINNLTFTNNEIAWLDSGNNQELHSRTLDSLNNSIIQVSPLVVQNASYGSLDQPLIGLYYFGGHGGVLDNITSSYVGVPIANPEPYTIIQNSNLIGYVPDPAKSWNLFGHDITIKDTIEHSILCDTGSLQNYGVNLTWINMTLYNSSICVGISGNSYSFITNVTLYDGSPIGTASLGGITANNTIGTDINVINSSNGILLLGDMNYNYNTTNVSLTNLYIYNNTGSSTNYLTGNPHQGLILYQAYDWNITNTTLDTFLYPFFMVKTNNSIILNLTAKNFYGTNSNNAGKLGIVLRNINNDIFTDIELTITNLTFQDTDGNSTNNKFININVTNITTTANSNFDRYYYADINVTNSTGSPISGATIIFTNTVNSSYPSINRAGIETSSYTTGTNGHTPLPIGNDSTTVVLMNMSKNSTYQENMSYTVTVSAAGYTTNSSVTISQDSSWYRSNPNTYQNTTTIILTASEPTSTITIPANSWGMFNNWSYITTFSGIATNESNDVAFTLYNVTSGEWDSYYPGYSWNSGHVIDKNNSILGFFNAQTTITVNTVTPWDTSITEGWNMLYLMGTTNRTMTEICTNMVNCTGIYYYNSTINDYVSTGTDTIQPNQGFLAYVNQTGTWIRSTL